ncbi:hypothetical protein BVY04_03260 [bacterium M21]|nr:hypothetical protein BVY04_03260 [bacterium M21]
MLWAHLSLHEGEGATITLSFDHVGSGLMAKDAVLRGFAIAGADKHWHWAEAVIKGDSIVVQSPKVSIAVAVRYNWAINPIGNLFNKEGLSASVLM